MATNITFHAGSVSAGERSELLKQKGVTIWLTGLSGSGKVQSWDMIRIATQTDLHRLLVYHRLRSRAIVVASKQVRVPPRW